MRRVPVRLPLAALITVAALIWASAASAAGPRYASPSGSAAQDCTTPATACDITTALEGSGANQPTTGQEVVVEPGTYVVSTTLTPHVDLNIHGVLGQPRPVIQGSTSLLHPQAFNGTMISYLDLEYLGPGGTDAVNTDNAILDGVVIRGNASGVSLCQCYDGTLRNSVLINTGGSGTAWGVNSNGGQATEALRNDTFVATQPGGYAMWLSQQAANPGTATLAADARNVIAINTAAGHDVGVNGKGVSITLSYSDYSSPNAAAPATIVNAGHNLSAAPVFVDLAHADFRQRLSSPGVDAGTDDATDGTVDFAGNPRQAGLRTDLGAFEYQPAAHVVAAADAQSTTVGTVFMPALAAKVTDAQGNPVSEVTVTFTAPASGPGGTFPGGMLTATASTDAGGVAQAPAFTANPHAGPYVVSASVGSPATPGALSLRNLPGAPASLQLSPATATLRAGASERYAVGATDAYGNASGDVSAVAHLTLSPNGSCSGARCTALRPGRHTVAAALGGLHTTAVLTITAHAPALSLRTRTVNIDAVKHRGSLGATCSAPVGDACAVSGQLTVGHGKRTVRLGRLSGRIRGGARGSLTISVSRAVALSLAARPRRVNATLVASGFGGHRTYHTALTLKFGRHRAPGR